MQKPPKPPPRHRAYPRGRPAPVRADATRGATAGGWQRAVPEHRVFPRSR